MVLFGNFLNNGPITVFMLFVYSFWGGDIDKVSRDGFYWIIKNVIFQVGKSGLTHFPHNYRYYSLVNKFFPNVFIM